MGKLLQKPEVIVVEQADVLDAVLQQRDPVDTETERPAGIAFGVVADRLEDGGVHHAAPAQLQPGAVGTADVELGRRFGEREVGRTQAGCEITAEVGPGEGLERARQVTEGVGPASYTQLTLPTK